MAVRVSKGDPPRPAKHLAYLHQPFSFRLRIDISLSLPCALPDCPLTHFCCIVLAGMYGGAAAEEAAVWGPEAPFSPSLAQFMAAWGVAPGPVFQSSSGRWASPHRAVFASLYTGVLCVRTLSAEPFWLSLCFDVCVHMVNVRSVSACDAAGGENPKRCAHGEHAHTACGRPAVAENDMLSCMGGVCWRRVLGR